MTNVVSFEECREDPTCAESIGFESDENENMRRGGVRRAHEMLVQVRYEAAREVHDAGSRNKAVASTEIKKLRA